MLAVANMIAHEDDGMLRSHYKKGALVIPGLYSDSTKPSSFQSLTHKSRVENDPQSPILSSIRLYQCHQSGFKTLPAPSMMTGLWPIRATQFRQQASRVIVSYSYCLADRPSVLIDPTSQGAFANAHHFNINHLNQIENLNVPNNAYPEPVIERLLGKGKPTAIHDSSARAYPPLCHPDTRKTLRGRVVRWGMGDGDERILWIL
ncbi:hypothetical protein P691DRAFT_782366, partial [Macrolepiota fuliginosa MF-IS2]